jgi:hypothetical protein
MTDEITDVLEPLSVQHTLNLLGVVSGLWVDVCDFKQLMRAHLEEVKFDVLLFKYDAING